MLKNLPVKTGCLILAMIFLQGCAIVILPSLKPRKSPLEEVVLEEPRGWFTRDKVLLLDISGVLTAGKTGGIFGSSHNTVDELKEALRKAESDPRIRAVVLRIDTPGGGVTASDIIYREIREFRERTGKPVIAQMMGMAASGGVYISMAADRIYAHPTTLTGNIGVISVFPRLEGLAGKIGMDVRVIKSGDKKDIGSMWRDFTPEERRILQSVIDEYYGKFLEVVLESRGNAGSSRLREIADGRVLTAWQALEAGLIDGVCYLPESIEKAKEESGISDSVVVTYKRRHEYRENIYSLHGSEAPSARTQIGLFNVDAGGVSMDTTPRFMYLWAP